MLTIKDLQALANTQAKAVFIKSWGGEVKLKPLSIAERAQVTQTLQKSGDLQNIKLSDLIEAGALTAHFALVEPKLSLDEIKALPEQAFEGIKEIGEIVEKLNEKK